LTPEIERLVEELRPQARSEAWRWHQTAPQQLNREELESLACYGLAMAGARWELYCEQRGFSPGCGLKRCTDPMVCAASRYFAAYALRRMRGAMLDHMRSADWVTRSVRQRAKALREAGQDTGASVAELEQRTGLSASQQDETLAAVARRPVSMDADPVEVADSEDVESRAVVSSVLDALTAALRSQPFRVQAILALHYYQGEDLKTVAARLHLPEDEVSALHQDGILLVHRAMLAAATVKEELWP
jgi:RNA polymerase sigma factor (sigma-70 family)